VWGVVCRFCPNSACAKDLPRLAYIIRGQPAPHERESSTGLLDLSRCMTPRALKHGLTRAWLCTSSARLTASLGLADACVAVL
jgi:hypothetical protein